MLKWDLMFSKEGCVYNNKVSLHFYEWGAKDGLPIVFLHGLQATALHYEEFCSSLARKYRVFALDFRGHGGSDKPVEGYELFDYISDVRALVEALKLEDPVVIGHSLGAIVSMVYAAEYKAMAVIAMEAPSIVFHHTTAKVTIPFFLLSIKLKMPNEFSNREEAVRYFRKAGVESHEIDRAIIRNLNVRSNGKLTWKFSWPAVEKTLKNIAKVDLWKFIPKIKCPVLLIRGEKGLFREKDAKKLAEIIPKSQMIKIKEAEHDVFQDNLNEVLMQIESFLTKLK